MRRAVIGLACLGCAPMSAVEADLRGARTLVVEEGPTSGGTVVELTSEGAELLDRAPWRVHAFAEDRATLRLGAETRRVEEPSCPADELPASAARLSLCRDDGGVRVCEPDPGVVFAREPLIAGRCGAWRLPVDERRLFDLGTPGGSGVIAEYMGGGRVLLGQLQDTPEGPVTRLRVLDVPRSRDDSVFTDLLVDLRMVLVAARPRDLERAWILRSTGELGSLTLATGEVEWVVGAPRTDQGPLHDFATSPEDPEDVLAATTRCGLLRRNGASWRVVRASFAHAPAGVDDDLMCEPRFDWSDASDALLVGFVAGLEPRTLESLVDARRNLVHVEGEELREERLEFPPEHRYGTLYGVARYLAAGGERVTTVSGLALDSAQILDIALDPGPKSALWWVQDPRAGGGWRRLTDPDTIAAFPLVKLIAWGDGVIGTGGYTQAFSDRYYRLEPNAALSERIGASFLNNRAFRAIADDGAGGFVLGLALTGGADVFEWRKAAAR